MHAGDISAPGAATLNYSHGVWFGLLELHTSKAARNMETGKVESIGDLGELKSGSQELNYDTLRDIMFFNCIHNVNDENYLAEPLLL